LINVWWTFGAVVVKTMSAYFVKHATYLEISMYNTYRMHIADSFKNLPHYLSEIKHTQHSLIIIIKKAVHLYSALHGMNYSTHTWITQFNLQGTPCLLLPRVRSPDGASTDWDSKHLTAAHYSCIDPKRMKDWVILVGWPPVDGLST